MLICFGGFTFVRKWFVFVRRSNFCSLFLESLCFTNQNNPSGLSLVSAVILSIRFCDDFSRHFTKILHKFFRNIFRLKFDMLNRIIK